MHIARLVSRLFKLFIPSFIENVAKSSGFMKRHSKLLPETFAKAIKENWTNHKTLLGFAPDHGCHEIDGGAGSHGLMMPEDMNIIHFYKVI